MGRAALSVIYNLVLRQAKLLLWAAPGAETDSAAAVEGEGEGKGEREKEEEGEGEGVLSAVKLAKQLLTAWV